MKQASKSLIQNVLKRFNIGITSYQNLRKLVADSDRRAADDIEFILKLPDELIPLAIRNLRKSRSQLRQDLFVLSELGFKKGGFFVEFGATNGVDLSNTYLLEKDFEWTGILAEPAKCWQNMLRQNRKCQIDTRCVWSSSDLSLAFNEVKVAELSTIDEFSKTDFHKDERKDGTKYLVKTITLRDLLDSYSAPKDPDYLSIDTEGSEFEILEKFDFEKYKFKVITCEHNFTAVRDNIYRLLSSYGYARRFEDVSAWDDWYVKL
jgi:FkbM family methyltransferase